MTFKLLSIDETKNVDRQRKRINTMVLAVVPGYGSALPDAAISPDGAIFYIGSQGYQNRNGTWTAL